VPEIHAKMLGVIETRSADVSGVHRIDGALALSPADTDASFAVQSRVETISGTGNNDFINSDNPIYAGVGTSTRLVELTTTLPDPAWEVVSLKVTGLPDGYSIVGAREQNGSYLVEVDPTKNEIANLNLQYILPVDGAAEDINGFFKFFTLKLEYTVKNAAANVVGTTVGNIAFGIRDIQIEADAEYKDPVTNEPIYVLWSKPPGTIVNAGDGDDTVVAGAGTDVLDGGNGTDLISYKLSGSAVNVNIGTNSVSGGYAAGDRISGFESIEGSNFNDTLTGNADNNILTGGKGADRIDGGDGNDTANYAGSTAAVSIDLSTGTGTGGEAQGDTLVSIERVVGSKYNDTFKADVTSATFEGGEGNDRFISGDSADVLNGGDGNDTADYSNSSAGVTVDLRLTGGQVSAGAANGDILNSIENVTGSSGDDALTGNSGANVIIGGAGNDTLISMGGADTLDGGADVDTADFSMATSAVNLNLSTGNGIGVDGSSLTLLNLETCTAVPATTH